ncbi:unnamed protein product, partial [Mesorhabditis belari]|uniref:Uncharacterized protein n=1 Tax=Mesorhabditis belari TaxID=2138241 RepID=A0AAF3J9M7_9BILA
MDIENNEVLKMLRFTGLGIRESQLVYGSNMDVYNRIRNKGDTISSTILGPHGGPNNGTDLKAEEILKEERNRCPVWLMRPLGRSGKRSHE